MHCTQPDAHSSAAGTRLTRYGRAVTATAWTLDAADGQLLVETDVTGRAARMGHRLTIALDIHGVTRECAIDRQVEELGDAWRMSCRADVRQPEFGIKPYSILMGSMKVVDTVAVSFSAERAKPPITRYVFNGVTVIVCSPRGLSCSAGSRRRLHSCPRPPTMRRGGVLPRVLNTFDMVAVERDAAR